jgi:NAD(P)H-flavin reductase
MIEAAEEDAKTHLAVWEATIVDHELRRFDIAVFRAVTSEPLAYLPGQSVSIGSSARPRLWRLYSIANAPREDSTIDFHVRLVEGGALSMVLTRGLSVGSRPRIGPPVSSLTLDTGSGRDVLLVAGSTGLAPLKAILEQISGLDPPPSVHLFTGAQSADALYDAVELEKLAVGCPWLTITPVVSGEPGFPGERGQLPDVVTRSGNWRDHDVYIAGPTPMVQATTARLTGSGVPSGQIHAEDFGWSEP